MPTVVVHGVILPLRCKVIFHASVGLLPKLRLQLSRSFWVSVSVYQSQLCLLSTLLGEQLHSLLSPAPPLFNLIYGFLPLKNLHSIHNMLSSLWAWTNLPEQICEKDTLEYWRTSDEWTKLSWTLFVWPAWDFMVIFASDAMHTGFSGDKCWPIFVAAIYAISIETMKPICLINIAIHMGIFSIYLTCVFISWPIRT